MYNRREKTRRCTRFSYSSERDESKDRELREKRESVRDGFRCANIEEVVKTSKPNEGGLRFVTGKIVGDAQVRSTQDEGRHLEGYGIS